MDKSLMEKTTPPTFSTTNDPLWLIIINGTFLTIILCTGLFVNITLLFLLSIKYTMRTPTNLLLGNLAFSNLIGCAVLLIMLSNVKTTRKLSATNYCEFTAFSQQLWLLSSVFTLVCLSYDRYKYITDAIHYHRYMTHKKVTTFIICIWLPAVAVSSANLFSRLKLLPTTHQYTCSIDWSQHVAFSIIYTILVYWLPLLATTYCYLRIYYSANRHIRVAPMPHRISECLDAQTKRRESINKKKLIIIFGTFLVAFTPELVIIYMTSFSANTITIFMQKTAQIWKYVPIVIYPYIFVFRDKHLRRQLRIIIHDYRNKLNAKTIHPSQTIDEQDYSENVSRRNSRTSLSDDNAITSRKNSATRSFKDFLDNSVCVHQASVIGRRESNESSLTNVYI